MPKDLKSHKKHQAKEQQHHQSTSKTDTQSTQRKNVEVNIEYTALDEFNHQSDRAKWHAAWATIVAISMSYLDPREIDQIRYTRDPGLLIALLTTAAGLAFISALHERFIPLHTPKDPNQQKNITNNLIVDATLSSEKLSEAYEYMQTKKYQSALIMLFVLMQLVVSNFMSDKQDRRYLMISILLNAFFMYKVLYRSFGPPSDAFNKDLKKKADFIRDIFDHMQHEHMRVTIAVCAGKSLTNSFIRIQFRDTEDAHLIIYTQRMKAALSKSGFTVELDSKANTIVVAANFSLNTITAAHQVKEVIVNTYADYERTLIDIKALNKQLKCLASKIPGMHISVIPHSDKLGNELTTFVVYIPQEYREVIDAQQMKLIFPHAQVEEIQERLYLKANTPSIVFTEMLNKLNLASIPLTTSTAHTPKNIYSTNNNSIFETKQDTQPKSMKYKTHKYVDEKAPELPPVNRTVINWHDAYRYQSDDDKCAVQPIRWPNGKIYPNHYAIFLLKPEDMTGENIDEMHQTFATLAADGLLAASNKGASGIKLFSVMKERRDPKTRKRFVTAAEIKISGNYGQKGNRRVFGELQVGPNDEKLIVWNHYDPDAHKTKIK